MTDTTADSLLTEIRVAYDGLDPRPGEIESHWKISDDDKLRLLFRVRTSSWSPYPNERTDLHDGLSTLFAIVLRIRAGISCGLWDEVHPITGNETELYSRFVTLEQPDGFGLSADAAGAEVVKEALLCLPAFARWFGCNGIFWRDVDARFIEEGTGPGLADEWAQRISEVFPTGKRTQIQWMQRVNPLWKHFRSVHPSVSVLLVPEVARSLRHILTMRKQLEVIDSPTHLFFVSERCRNVVAKKDVRILKRLLRACEPAQASTEPLLVPLENRIIGIGDSHIVSLLRDCGRKRFEREREKVRNALSQAMSALYSAPEFEWSDSIDDDRFELLVMALLKSDSAVRRVRKVGSSRDRDGGRDLLADWTTSPLPGEVLPKGDKPFRERRVVVQCKAYRRPVDKSRVTDIRDLVEHHQAGGYFLAVSSTLTSGLFDHLDRLRMGGRLWVDWWTRPELEERLQAHPEVAALFTDIVKAKTEPR